MESKTLLVKKSKNGRGIFTKKNFDSNEMILRLKGKLITCYEDDDLDERTRSNTIRISSEKFLNPEREFGEFINHSCSPNCRIVKKDKDLFLFTLEFIPKNTEVLFDYSSIIAKDDIWTMKCNCGNKNCRKIIKSFNLLPKKLQSNYIKEKIVPKYILAIK